LETTFSDLIILLSGGINQRRLYFDKHPRVQSQGRDFVRRLQELLGATGETAFFFGVLNGKFIKDGRYLVGPSIAGRNLIDCAEKLRCGGFLVHRDVEPDEVTAFFRIAAGLHERVATLEESLALFRSEGVRGIELTPHFRETGAGQSAAMPDLAHVDPSLIQFDFSDGDDEGGYGHSVSDELAPLLPIFQSMYEAVADNNIHISQDRDFDLPRAQGIGERLHDVADQQTMDLMNLMRYPDYDSYTIGHSVRVSTLALTVGREMGWPDEMLGDVATAGLLHDLGKGKIPDEILYKPGRLDPEERRIAESHAAIGAHILLARGDASPLAVAAAWGHHVRHDGGGYPKMPAWAVRSPIAGLIQVCDVFEALTAARPYKNPMPPRRAFEIILKERHAFMPQALSALIRAIGLYPPGSEVALSDSSRGFVVAKGPDWEQPIVRVVRDPDGRLLEKRNQYILKLHEEPGLEVSDFLMVSMNPDEALEGADAPTTEELVAGLDDMFEDATM
jgi:putative nucleotidyltransferase with HDIG domain